MKNVYIIDPKSFKILKWKRGVHEFHCEVKEELGNCGVKYTEVKNNIANANIVKDIKEEDIVIAYNDNKNNIDLNRIVQAANDKKAEILFVAMNKDARKPSSSIKELLKKQSYDVQEQLRCRGLSDRNQLVVAKAFSRYIVAKCYPALFPEKPFIFLSHKRSDGEDITSKIHDRLTKPAMNTVTFRDVADVRAGEEAQRRIDSAMAEADVFIFLHTPDAPNSAWIRKEIMYAMTRHIPILWVRFYGANPKELWLEPVGKPHLSYTRGQISLKGIDKVVQEIFEKAMSLVLEKSITTINLGKNLCDLLGNNIRQIDENDNLYKISVERKNYIYPQRNIEQYVQLFGRALHREDVNNFKNSISKYGRDYDSAVILSDKIIRKATKDKKWNVLADSYNNFYSAWDRYINGERMAKNMEIVISGAFPDNNEIFQHCLTDALVLLEKELLSCGYKVTFGAHPTFQELFFEVAKETCPKDYKDRLNMYISDYFIENYKVDMIGFDKKFTWERVRKIDGDREQSLALLREAMIARKEVKALVCLGGMIREGHPDHEGIREEIRVARTHGIPVFVVGSVGGCSSIVAKEYEKKGWEQLNDAGDYINEKFLNEIDYRGMARAMIDYLESEECKEV